MVSRSWANLYYTSRLLDINCGQFGEAKLFTPRLMSSQACHYTLVYKGSNFFRHYPSKNTSNETSENGDKNPPDSYEPAFLTANEFSKLLNYQPTDLFDFKTRMSSFKDYDKERPFNESKHPLLFLLGSTSMENFAEAKPNSDWADNRYDPMPVEQNSPRESHPKTENDSEFTTYPSNYGSKHSNKPEASTLTTESTNENCNFMEINNPEQPSSNEIFFFSVDISNIADPPIYDGYAFKNLLQVPTHSVNELNATLLMKARGMSHYHRNRLYCGKCGNLMRSKEFGSFRICTNSDCKFWEYPRLDPAVIMLIYKGEYCLLGHKSIRRLNFYSCLAGFTSMGESLEQTVERETYEETGVKININTFRYFGSQPWLFPQSLMFGFSAEANHCSPQPLTDIEKESLEIVPLTSRGGNIKDSKGNITYLPKIQLLDGELEDAQWFHMDLIKKMVYKSEPSQTIFHLPMPASIAFQLIKDWVDRAPVIKASI